MFLRFKKKKKQQMGRARSPCATSFVHGPSSWRHDRARPVRDPRGAPARREALRRVVRALRRGRVLLGPGLPRPAGSAESQLARLRGQAPPQAAHRAAEATDGVRPETGEPLPPSAADARDRKIKNK